MELSAAIAMIQSPFTAGSGATRWADLGAGSGLFTKALAHCLSVGSKIYAADRKIMPSNLDLPTGISLEALTLDFVSGEMPFRDLDGILMANALHYVKEKKPFVDKIKRWLKPSGTVLIVEYDSDRPVRGWVPYPVDFAALGSLFTQAGFGRVRKLQELPSLYGGTLYSAIISRIADPAKND